LPYTVDELVKCRFCRFAAVFSTNPHFKNVELLPLQEQVPAAVAQETYTNNPAQTQFILPRFPNRETATKYLNI